MPKGIISKAITTLIALVWFVNGLFCKVLNYVPRHQEIVSEILGVTYAAPLTTAIGISEVIMAIWVISGFKSRMNAILQITIICAMNFLEFLLVPRLLLWGRWNAFFALVFVGLIYYNEFVLKKQSRP